MAKSELKNINMIAKFTNFQVINKDFTRCRCNVFYTGRNRNYSDITEDALQKFIARKGYANIPVVAHLMKDDDGKYYIGGHDSKIVIDNNGIELVNECVPFGVIPEDCNPSMDLITERSGEQRKYFSVDIVLWTHRYPIMEAAYSDEIYFNQSMEIFFEDYSWDQDYVVVNDFSMSALCLLRRSMDSNENIEPCFESSRVKAFSIDADKFKQNFELMLEKLKQYESDGIATTVRNNETNEPNKEVKEFMDLKKFTEILSTEKIGESDVCKYRLLNVTDSKVFALDIEDYKPYGFNYAVMTEANVENIVIDFNSKVEMSLSATDKITDENFEEFSIKSEIDSITSTEVSNRVDTRVAECTATLEAEFNKKMEEMKTSFEDLSASHKIALEKLSKFEAKEASEKAKAHEKEINDLFEKYSSKLSKCAEFLVYKAKTVPSEVTVDEVNEKLTLMVGKFMMDSQTKKNFSYEPTVAGANGRTRTNETVENKYGHLLDKYIK